MKKIPFVIGILSILIFWKNTILHIGTHIHDWYDGAFIIWTIQNNVKHFQMWDFAHLFETNAMYPFSNSLSFTDHLFVPSFFAFLISVLTPNPLLQFNVLSIGNHILVFISFYLLAGRFSKNSWIKLITALYGSFSPYFFSQLGHFQMIFMWPLILSLFFLLHPKKKTKQLIISGIFLGLQFLTGAYLGLIGFTVIMLYFAATVIYKLQMTKSKLKTNNEIYVLVKSLVIFTSVFLLVSSVSVYGYLKVNMQYKPVRDQGEFVTYSAHITDYIFVTFNNSWFNRNIFQALIGKFNQHTGGEQAGFVGVIPIVVGAWWLVIGKKQKISFPCFWRKMSILKLWLILLIIVGFVFSLGPRLNWNGTYLVTPLPYWLLMKLFPPIAIMRAVSRWYFMVVFAVTFMMTYGLDQLVQRYKKLTTPILILAIFGMFIEFYPVPVQVQAKNWISPSYLYLQKVCKDKPGAVLEYPFEYRYKFEDIATYLSLKTNTLLSSTLHNCPTLSGFSSYEPPLFKKWQKDFDENGITNDNIKILKANHFAFIKINLEALSLEERTDVNSIIHTASLTEIFRDDMAVIYKID